MGKLVVVAFMTLDGVVQAPGAPDEDRDGGFEHGGWVVPLADERMVQVMTELTIQADALLVGRRTYEVHAAAWPQAPADDPVGAKLNAMPKYVASGVPLAPEWQNSTRLTGDVAEEAAKLKTRYEEIHTSGSGTLVQALMEHGLVDAYHLLVFPVLLGSGKRLFAEGTIPAGLRLTGTETTSTGVVISSYERHGDVAYGAMEHDGQ